MPISHILSSAPTKNSRKTLVSLYNTRDYPNIDYIFTFFQEGNLQRNWQEQQESKEVALANLTLLTQKIPKDNNPIKVGLSFAEGSNTLLNLDIGEFKIVF